MIEDRREFAVMIVDCGEQYVGGITVQVYGVLANRPNNHELSVMMSHARRIGFNGSIHVVECNSRVPGFSFTKQQFKEIRDCAIAQHSLGCYRCCVVD
jgi:hypothetical protein